MHPSHSMRLYTVLVLVGVLRFSPAAFAFSKTAQKGVFIGGLLTIAGVVRHLIRGDEAASEARVRALRGEWGEPVRVAEFETGWDRFRIEISERAGQRATATYRNGRLIRVEVDGVSPPADAPLVGGCGGKS